MVKFSVWLDDENVYEEGDAESVECHDAQDAAIWLGQFSDYHDSDYSIAKGDDAFVFVRNVATRELTRWRVRAETSPTYYASLERR